MKNKQQRQEAYMQWRREKGGAEDYYSADEDDEDGFFSSDYSSRRRYNREMPFYDPFAEFDGISPRPSNPSSHFERSDPFFRRGTRYANDDEDDDSFGKVAGRLLAALKSAGRFFRDLESSFASDVARIAAYAEPKVIDQLWRAKLYWDGFNRTTGETAHGRGESFKQVSGRLAEAYRSLKAAGSPNGTGHDDFVWDVDVENTILRRLEVSIKDLGSSIKDVKTDRGMTRALLRQCVATQKLVEDLQEV